MKRFLTFMLIYISIFAVCFTVVYIHTKQYENCKYTIINSNGNSYSVISYKKINENCIKAYDENNDEIIMCGEYTITPR
jgi:hypothetical protein